MLRSIKYLRPKVKPGDPPAKHIVILRDSCFGEVRFKKLITCDIHAYFIYVVMKAYTARNRDPIQSLVRCLSILYREYSMDMYYVLDKAIVIMAKYLPTINFRKYIILLHRVYIPRIISGSI